MALRQRVGMLRLIVVLQGSLFAAAPAASDPTSPCPPCFDCIPGAAASRVVRVRMYNGTRLKQSTFATILEVTNRVWAPYGVSIEPTENPDAITVAISSGTLRGETGHAPLAVGDTLFSNGHATPYIRLWLGAAELVAEHSNSEGPPFTAKTSVERETLLLRILGVALAHELGHYLLDTAHHSADGLLRRALTARDMEHPDPAHLRLTRKQQQVMCQTPAVAVPE